MKDPKYSLAEWQQMYYEWFNLEGHRLRESSRIKQQEMFISWVRLNK